MTAIANMLMGMIGTTLFVGTSVGSGAMIGPRYEQARLLGEAADVVGALQQTAHAVVLQRTVDGGVGDAGQVMSGAVKAGWLAEAPTGPGGTPVAVVDSMRNETGLPRYVEMRLPLDTTGRLCDAVAQQGGDDTAPAMDSFPANRLGCVKSTEGSVAYLRV